MTTSRRTQVSPSGDTVGVKFSRLQPGGRNGPNDEVRNEVPLGQVWTDQWVIGAADGDFQMMVPDIRMPANQFWPPHWHDESIAVVVLDGSVMLGDWWMTRGDIAVSLEDVEYGPLLMGPTGCQLLETFSRSRAGGGYGEEYRDHPTLSANRIRAAAPEMMQPSCGSYVRKGSPFGARPPGSEQNAGRAVIPNASIAGMELGSLSGSNRYWCLGAPDDPLRSVLLDTGYEAGLVVPPHRHRDARWVLVMNGSMRVGDREITRDDVLMIESGVHVPEFEAGADGVQLLEFVRTIDGLALVVDDRRREDLGTGRCLDAVPYLEFDHE
jgi:hypothetical protein